MKKEQKILRKILAGLIIFTLFSCRSIKKPAYEYKDIDFIYVVEYNKSNIGLTKSKLEARVADLLTGYVYGIDFSINDDLVKTNMDGSISMIDKNSQIELKEVNKKAYMVETGTYNYPVPKVKNYRKRYVANITKEDNDFWKTYTRMLSEAVKVGAENGDNGKIIPLGELNVKISKNGQIRISEKFEIFIF